MSRSVVKPKLVSFEYPLEYSAHSHAKALTRARKLEKRDERLVEKHMGQTHGYNLSMACLHSDLGLYIYHVRYTFMHSIFRMLKPVNPLRPGNAPDKCSPKNTRSFSTDFFWNRWSTAFGHGLFGVWSAQTGRPCRGSQVVYLQPNMRTNVWSGDDRFFATDDGKRLFVHSSRMHQLSEITFDPINKRIGCDTLWKYQPEDKRLPKPKLYNATILSVNDIPLAPNRMDRSERLRDLRFTVLDWFYRGKLYVVDMDVDSQRIKRRTLIKHVKLNRRLNKKCTRSRHEPIFSFSTNTIGVHVNVPIKGIDTTTYGRLGVGHLKINVGNIQRLNKVCYPDNPRLDQFRQLVHRRLLQKFGDKYIEYRGRSVTFRKRGIIFNKTWGYIYCMYFYFICRDDHHQGKHRMLISDAYLPINMRPEHDDKCKFSLFFPMSLMDQPNENALLISGGEGDFYSVLLKFQRDSVLNRSILKHDVTSVDLARDYQYHLLEFC